MVDLAWKDVRSHKLRSFLTALAVILAVTAIISLGSISSGMNSLVQEQLTLVSGKIVITATEIATDNVFALSSWLFFGEVDYETLDEIAKISGVESVAGMRIESYDGYQLVGGELEKRDEIGLEMVELEEGDWPDVGEDAVVVGYYAKDKHKLSVGDYVSIEGEDLRVIGHLEEIGGAIDYSLLMSWKTLDNVLEEAEYFSIAFVRPQDISLLDEVSEKIKEEYSGLYVATAESVAKDSQKTINLISLLTLGIGVIATLVAMFGIINTMLMSVSEKQKEIGIMKAIGATDRQITLRFFEESVLISVFGCLAGIVFGCLGTVMLNNYLGVNVAKVTANLAINTVVFIFFITVMATLYPAHKAAKTDPIKAIKQQH